MEARVTLINRDGHLSVVEPVQRGPIAGKVTLRSRKREGHCKMRPRSPRF